MKTFFKKGEEVMVADDEGYLFLDSIVESEHEFCGQIVVHLLNRGKYKASRVRRLV